ncbi:MAG TPA: UvrD-helicase domain-containing protein [Dongiaceae bacterium]|nr:UvrD-helicase domain-containing protein [Dongiaceae bacterium]
MSRDYVLQPFRRPLELQIDYAGELNEQQFAAVTAAAGPALVIAGAGSGKTRTLTYRVAYLLEQGVAAERILLLTFTNKAAREMMRRVAGLLGQELSSLWGGTFHAIGNRVLRRQADLLGYQRDFTILDREDAKHLLTTCVAESGIDHTATRFPKAEVLAEIFSLAVNTGRTIHQILDEEYGHFSPLAAEVSQVEQLYARRKRATNTMDFDDLLALWLKLLQEQPEAREQYQRRFEFVLVDEYQDTNKLQSELIDLLAARHRNVMVVGDDAQSIYSWRGANFENILKFPERYPDAKTYKIETNYRSTPEILKVANAAIAANAGQFAKELAPVRQSGPRPSVVACQDGFEQAAFVAQRALELREEGVQLNRMAVLYRSHFHALELQLELTRRNIPFSITSGIRFFEQAHIKDMAAYLKLVANPRDELAFVRLAQLLPGIGGKGAAKLWRNLSARFSEPAAPPASPSGSRPVARLLQGCAPDVPKKAAAGWAQFVATVSQLEAEGLRRDPSAMLDLVLEAGYEDYLEDNYTNYRSRLEDLTQLASFARQFSTLEDFLSQLALLTNLEAEEDRPAPVDDEQIRLSTIHQAKGLEFDIVFVIMLCDGLFPSQRSLKTPAGEEEERRLMYVAVTRARDELYLTYPLIRAGYGGSMETLQHPSRFVNEIPKDLVEEVNLRTFLA